MITILLALALAQTQPVNIVDPRTSARKATITTVGGSEALDVNCVAGCSGAGGGGGALPAVLSVTLDGGQGHVVVDQVVSVTLDGGLAHVLVDQVISVTLDGGLAHVVVDSMPTVTVTGTFFPAAQTTVIDSGTVDARITNQQAQWTVVDGGTVNVGNLPAVQPVSTAQVFSVTLDGGQGHMLVDQVLSCTADGGSLEVSKLPALPAGSNVIGHVIVDSAPTTAASQSGSWSMLQSGTWTVGLSAGSQVIGHVIVDTAPTTAVTGTFWQATQPVSGTFFQATQPVSIASMPSTPVTGTFFQATQPVSIASMPSTPVTGTFFQATQPVSIASMPSTPVTGVFFQAVQPISSADGGLVVETGVDQLGQTHTLLTDTNGAQLFAAPRPLPLPRCNPVRRFNCQ